MTGTTHDETEGAYAGLRVLDLSQGIAGPYCAGLLAQQGADVIKVEPPSGDWVRGVGSGREGMTPLAIAGNLGKRSIAIDAANAPGRELLLRLARKADVVVQNYRPGVIERLGLGYEAIAADNPGVIYVSITGFGASGPDAKRPGTDSVLQSLTGIAHANRDSNGVPRRVPLLIPDTVTALYAAQAIGGALYARGLGGKGRHIGISLMESCAAFQAAPVINDFLFGEQGAPLTVPSGVFRTRDGWLTLVAISDEQFFGLLRVLGLDEWIDDPRFATLGTRQSHAALVNAEVARRLEAADSANWIEKLAAEDVLFAPIQDYGAFRISAQAQDQDFFGQLAQSPYGAVPVARAPGNSRAIPLRPAPRVGEHCDEVLQELGLAAGEIDALVAAGVVARERA